MPQIFQKTAKVNPSPEIGNVVLLSETDDKNNFGTHSPRKVVFDKY